MRLPRCLVPNAGPEMGDDSSAAGLDRGPGSARLHRPSLRIALLRLMRQPAAGGVGPCRVDCGTPFLDVRDLSLFIHHEGGPVRHPKILDQYAVGLHYSSVGEIAQQRE